MPYGTGLVARQVLQSASPWQRYLVAVAMVGGGVGLMLIGRVGGGLLSVAGIALLWRMVRHRLRRRGATQAGPT